MRLLLPALALLLTAAPASAQSLRLATETFTIAATADWMSTRSFVKRGGTEDNPMLRWAQSRPDAMVAIGATADAVTVYALHKKFGRCKPDSTGYRPQNCARKRALAIGLFAASAFRGWLAYGNMTRRPTTSVTQFLGPFAPEYSGRTIGRSFNGRS
jgi:hypothetical protein